MHRALFLLITWLLPSLASAATIDVPGNFGTIGGALGSASAGDSIRVASGTYPELLTLVDGVVLFAATPSQRPILDGTSTGTPITAVNCGPTTAVLDFLVRNGSSSGVGGGARLNASSVRFERCRFEDGSALQGGGLGAEGSDFTVIDCEFTNNVATENGGAIFATDQSSATISGSEFLGNQALVGGGVAVRNGATPAIDGSLFFGNHADEGAAVWYDFLAGGSLTGNTIVGEEVMVANGGAIFLNVLCTPLVTNNVIAHTIGGGATFAVAGADPIYGCNLTFGNAAGDSLQGGSDLGTNLIADPLFCDGPAGDWTVRESSPCIGGPCGQIGAFGVGCNAVSAQSGMTPASWGRVKALFR